MSDGDVATARRAVLAMLGCRARGATICPSEVARALAAAARSQTAASDWRAMMSIVHAAVDSLVADGQVRLSWKGQILSLRTGAYRIGQAESDPAKR